MPSHWYKSRKAEIAADFPARLNIQPRCPPHQKYAPILVNPVLDSTPMLPGDIPAFINRTQHLVSGPDCFDIAFVDGSRVEKKATSKLRRKIGCASACVYYEVDRSAREVTQHEFVESGRIQTVLETELCAIKLALEHAIRGRRNTKIFCDSLSAIRTLQSARLSSPTAIECHELLRSTDLRIHISHCLAHVGIPGNEEVHGLANRAAKNSLSEISRTPGRNQTISFNAFRELFKQALLPVLNEGYFFDAKHSFKHVQIMARYVTEACHLQAYLFRIGKSSDPMCPDCEIGCAETVQHFVHECPAHQLHRDLAFQSDPPKISEIVDFVIRSKKIF